MKKTTARLSFFFGSCLAKIASGVESDTPVKKRRTTARAVLLFLNTDYNMDTTKKRRTI